jgi:hypothetical protein
MYCTAARAHLPKLKQSVISLVNCYGALKDLNMTHSGPPQAGRQQEKNMNRTPDHSRMSHAMLIRLTEP